MQDAEDGAAERSMQAHLEQMLDDRDRKYAAQINMLIVMERDASCPT